MYENTCKFCGKKFRSRTKVSTCTSCRKLDDVIFSKIEAYLRLYPNSNAVQIAEGIGIAAVEVLRYIDEGRLRLSKGVFQKL